VTLDDIKARCDEVGDCWEWKGAYSPHGTPVMYARAERTTVRRVVWRILKGEPLDPKLMAGVKCNNPRCVHPDHVKPKTKAQVLGGMAKNGNQALRAAKIAASQRKRSAKLDETKVAHIRASNATNVALAAELGVHHSLISAIRKGRAWRQFASPFAGVGAR